MDRNYGAPARAPIARTPRIERFGEGSQGRKFGLDGARHGRSAGLAALALACCALLSGCVDSNVAETPVPSAPQTTNMPRHEGVSPSGATVAVASFSGAPQEVAERFAPLFADAAKRGEIAVGDSDTANYLVRGYLHAYPEGNVTAVAFVLDIFDSNKRRTQRVEDEVVVPGQTPDPWARVDDSVLAAVAAKSTDDLAAVMTNTPEALMAAGVAPSDGHNVASEDGQTTVAATPPATALPVSPPPGGLGLAALR